MFNSNFGLKWQMALISKFKAMQNNNNEQLQTKLPFIKNAFIIQFDKKYFLRQLCIIDEQAIAKNEKEE